MIENAKNAKSEVPATSFKRLGHCAGYGEEGVWCDHLSRKVKSLIVVTYCDGIFVRVGFG